MSVRWGIAGTGRIASDFVRDIAHIGDAEVVAVASRSLEGAKTFASARGIARAHGSVEALVEDDKVDAVYVAGIHPVHRDHAIAAMRAGKHVLVEKPLAMGAAEAAEMVAVSRDTGRFLMEAMWTRFNPLHVELKRRVDSGEFGRVVSIDSDFSFSIPHDSSHRLFDPTKGGGSLLDVGIYPISLAWWWLGKPDAWTATGHVGTTGVDEQVELNFSYQGGRSAHLTCGSTFDGPKRSTITCETATIEIHAPSHSSPVADIRTAAGTETVRCAGPGLHHQVVEVHRCIAEGLRESPRMSHGDSLGIAAFMDDVLKTLHGG